MIELNLAGLAEVRDTFATLVPAVQKKALRELAQAAFDAAQHQVDTHTQTGALARSLRLRSDGDGGWLIGHDQQHAPYAPFVHWGTRAHLIRHREKSILRWATKDQKAFAKGSARGAKYLDAKSAARFGFVFARVVHHPGYKGHAYLVEAADEAVRQFDAIVRSLEV